MRENINCLPLNANRQFVAASVFERALVFSLISGHFIVHASERLAQCYVSALCYTLDRVPFRIRNNLCIH